MKFNAPLVLALAGVALAKGNSTNSQCKEVAKLTRLNDIVANTTLLNEYTDNNATKAAELEAKAAAGNTTLATLSSNTTLMTTCYQIFAVEDMEDDCDEMDAIQQANVVAANATLLAKYTKNNATKAAEFQAKVSAKAATLDALQSNTTLTAFCSTLNDKSSCKSMAKLIKQQDLVANTTALNDKFNGNATKVANYQAKVSAKAAKLATLMSNTTLLSTCEGLGITTAADVAQAAAIATTTASAKSAAVVVSPMAGAKVIALVSGLVYAIAML
ncbi:hypothetical protein BD289DRAFT_453244 [Coniella lustricola]|uniref:Uncharacterized protein n=1 Tax=Coniella lustricola TaxID=2025994 RepID=A0A2T3A805_9PEZI|nr:hypothetical protein BD289DRAFT_453244 [Coniella lustricola]